MIGPLSSLSFLVRVQWITIEDMKPVHLAIGKFCQLDSYKQLEVLIRCLLFTLVFPYTEVFLEVLTVLKTIKKL